VHSFKSMALSGHGMCWLPESSVRAELEQGRLVKAGGADLELTMEICLYRSMYRTHSEVERRWEHVNTER